MFFRLCLALFLLLSSSAMAGELQELTGKLSVRIIDTISESGAYSGKRVYSLDTQAQGKLSLIISDNVLGDQELRTGISFSALAEKQPNGSYLVSSYQTILPHSVRSSSSGVRTVLVLRVNFSNSTVSCSSNRLEEVLVTDSSNVKDFLSEASFEALELNFDRGNDSENDFFSVTIAANTSDTCDPDTWATLADDAVTAQGVDPSVYDHVVYVLPSNLTCDWGGLATVACETGCQAWIAICDMTALYAHELGHNFGADHSTTDLDNDGVIDDEYGDTSCPMGTAAEGLKHYHALHKENFGWYGNSAVQTVTDSELVLLSPTERSALEDESEYKLARIGVPGKIFQNIALEHYYATFRRREGSYSTDLKGIYRNKVTIHRKTRTGIKTYLLDTLSPLESFADGDTKITFLGKSTDAALVWLTDSDEAVPSYSVTGHVLKKNESPLSGNRAKAVKLTLKRAKGEKYTASLDDEGGFSFDALPAGIYKARLKVKKKKQSTYSAKMKVQYLVHIQNGSGVELVGTVKKR
ncbi:MAG: hypothetical protein KDD55_02185 [Bdellovibrionales bacterium]|nr:hypothetical protein [Bdellovibrionales bacterium]